MLLQKIKSVLRSKGYVLYTRPYELNIVGLRSKNTEANRFDDQIHVFYKVSGLKWKYHIYQVTTDPGTYWLKNPSYQEGTAMLAQGQYVHAYQIGMHRGQYKALVQRAPVTVMRDYNRDGVLDFNNGTAYTGLFGINIHHASSNGSTLYVDKYSAGCQVFQSIGNFNEFMSLCEQHKKLYGNQFTYTLVDFRSMNRIAKRNIVLGAVTLGLGLYAYYEYENN